MGSLTRSHPSCGSRRMAYWNHKSTSGSLPSEIRQEEEEKKQAELLREAHEAELQRLGDARQRLRELKLRLAELEPLKEKAWDEVTEAEEAQLETELALRAEIAELAA